MCATHSSLASPESYKPSMVMILLPSGIYTGQLELAEGHGIDRVCLRDDALESFLETHGHRIAKLCNQDVRLRNFWEARGYDIVRVCL